MVFLDLHRRLGSVAVLVQAVDCMVVRLAAAVGVAAVVVADTLDAAAVLAAVRPAWSQAFGSSQFVACAWISCRRRSCPPTAQASICHRRGLLIPCERTGS